MFLSALKAVGLADLLDIALVAVLVYALLVWFKRARAAFVAKGMLVLAAVYLFSRTTGMVMTTGIFHGFFAILLVALVVIFQEELRRIFERIAVWSLTRGTEPAASTKQTDALVRVIGDLARERIGALVVLRGQDPLERHLQGGWGLGGEFSEPLLKSIFDFHSMGHDGAVIIEGGRVSRFGCRLPLSKESGRTAKFGTRHMAALGLAELTDALSIVVSEERGTISVAQDGRIESLRGTPQLERRLEQFTTEREPKARRDVFQTFIRRNSREKGIAAAGALLLWVLFVMGAKEWRQDYDLGVQLRNIPEGLEVVSVEPEKVKAVFSGQMRGFYWVDRDKLAVRIDLSHMRRGLNHVRLTEGDVGRPAGFQFEEVDPGLVRIELARKKGTPKLSQWK
ncbi:MAG: diadenylate cyclase [Elusimicrobiota bacterium]